MPMTDPTTTRTDPEKLQKFLDVAVADIKGTMVLTMANLGDRLGLFKALAESPTSSTGLAERTGLQERYVREWLSGMTCAEYVEYDPLTRTFSLPPEHAQVLADEASPVFLAGLYQEMPAVWAVLDRLENHFEEGGGLSIGDYHRDWWDGMERFTGTWFENFLLQQWIPSAPDIRRRLEEGVHVADIGCGRGRALVKLAKAFPHVTGVGYDLVESNLEAARRHADEEGVGDRISFRDHDVHLGLPERYGLVTGFDALHDFADPDVALRALYTALEEDGSCLLLEFKVADRLEDNVNAMGAMLYGWSLTYCMTTSLGMGGMGLGTCGLPESKVRTLASEAGFSAVEVVPFENPFNVVYHLKKQGR
jgi:SAM-dependent methyltransferase